ncbi:hypothetical protein LEP1GSC050_2354 [Leptospira broomii serovar Hurstbridge str. 5399]|uniref:Uncharacterized protein n=1 Tax=Leptospira broomii serovar Hurstbridge str. 5399 TaxID=1049789 RepID=T0F9E4_9LEPT|nr:hypothetical protein LEP1GSC050_2354 [Leptospira broomii serovar Hurstbridge str. 5399]
MGKKGQAKHYDPIRFAIESKVLIFGGTSSVGRQRKLPYGRPGGRARGVTAKRLPARL